MMISLVGWLGTLLYLANHAYISTVENWRTKLYYSGNLSAAALLVVQSYILSSWQALAINAFWMIVSASLLMGMNLTRIPMTKKSFYLAVLALLTWVALAFLDGTLTKVFSTLGWTSTVVFCLCYLLFTAQKISQRLYLACNTYAAIALLPQLWVTENWPVFCLEVIWAGLSIWGIVKSYDNVHLID
ncbi:hypothetical protein QTP81_14700 [Alteromonas sp. ASW11-36]|uniref:CBU-0592-like domain-containing protein n=1 Tax=Alteromonas arenosi TaxID=3055817 RepID=A0ABT7T083_9ALTE|nr:hypothetical protein [Alteromonas sp. ASW11-36]MDM7861850.1 hypothetical protein [Alteromonas sp. ASW11-36]